MLGSITLTPCDDWQQPADIHAWIDQLVEDYRQGAIIEQHVNRWTLAAILRRRWAGQITFGTLNVVPNTTPAESVDEWPDAEAVSFRNQIFEAMRRMGAEEVNL